MSIYKYVSIISLITFSFLFSQDVILSLDGSSLNYESTSDIAGFQFDHDGCATGASGGDAGKKAAAVVRDKEHKKYVNFLPADK